MNDLRVLMFPEKKRQRVSDSGTQAIYSSDGIAKKVADVIPDFAWKDLTTESEKLKALSDKLRQLHIQQNITKKAVGVLILRNQALGKELAITKIDNIMAIKIFTKYEIVNNDKQESERFDEPEIYKIQGKEVHHSRVLRYDINEPILHLNYNRIKDLIKIYDDAGVIYSLNAQGILEVNIKVKEGEQVEESDLKKAKENIIKSLKGNERFIVGADTSLQAVNFNWHSPSDLIDKYIESISISIGIPRRILLGNEQGNLASDQDQTSFINRIVQERERHCLPMLKKLIEKTSDKIEVYFEKIKSVKPKEEAEIGRLKIETIIRYFQTDLQDIVPPKQFFNQIGLEWTDENEKRYKKTDKYIDEEEEAINGEKRPD